MEYGMWPPNYIAYSYDNFKKHAPNAQAISAFYANKENLLRSQLDIASVREVNLQNQANKGGAELQNLLAEILDPTQDALGKLIAAEGNIGKDAAVITTGRKTGLTTQTRDIVSYYSLPTALREINTQLQSWSEVAEQLTKGIKGLLTDVQTELGVSAETALDSAILAKWSEVGYAGLTKAERASMAPLRTNLQMINMPAKQQNKLAHALSILQRNIQKLEAVSNGASITKKDMVAIGKLTKAAVSRLSLSTSEATNLIFAMQAMNKAEGKWAGVQLKTKMQGQIKVQYDYDKAYQKRLKDLQIGARYYPVDQKADNWYRFGDGVASFTIQTSVKRYARGSLQKYGLGLMATRLGLLMDKAGVFANSSLLNAMISTAAGHPEDYAPANAEWEKVKNIVAAGSLLFALSGSVQGNSKLVFLVLNNKPYLITDIVRAVIRGLESGAPISDMLGVSNINRDVYVGMNVYKGTDPNSFDATLRSIETNRRVTSTWQSQSIKISLQSGLLKTLGML